MRKDLLHQIKGGENVPSYVLEYLLGKYCASDNDEEIRIGVDAVKETLLDELGYADRTASRQIGSASGEVLWTLLRDCPTPAVVDSWLAPSTRDIVRAGLRRASIDRVLEVWCACPPDVAAARYTSRDRHPGHFDAALLDDLAQVLTTAEPLGLGDVLVVATDRDVDVDHIARRILEVWSTSTPS